MAFISFGAIVPDITLKGDNGTSRSTRVINTVANQVRFAGNAHSMITSNSKLRFPSVLDKRTLRVFIFLFD